MTTQINPLTNQHPAPPPIKKLILHNIQSLPRAEIEPGPPGTLTVVIGESDVGKTALASRAIEKLFFNTIPTREIIRRGAKKAKITAIYDTPDNLAVSWEWKGSSPEKGRARYTITRDKMKPIIVEGSNRPGNVPDAVQELTGVRPVKIGNLNINFNVNRQLDGPFLGASVSPTERYRVLGALAGTLEVDEAVKEVGLEIFRARRREKGLAGEINNLGERIKEYDYLVELKHAIDKVDAKLAWIRGEQQRRDKLAALQVQITAQKKSAEEAGGIALTLEQTIEQAALYISRTEVNMARHGKLVALQQNITHAHQLISRAADTLNKTKSTPEIAATLTKLIDNNTKLSTLSRLRQTITTEKAKLTTAQQILYSTRSTETVQDAVEKLTKANHLHGQLLRLSADISASRGALLRHTETLEATREVDRCREVLDRASAAADKFVRLKNLAMFIKEAQSRVAATQRALGAISGVDQGLEILSQTGAKVARWHKLLVLDYQCRQKQEEIAELERDIEVAGQNFDAAAREYKALLLEAGVCEDCPVVDVVMAAS